MGQGRRLAQTGTETREERESKQAEMEALGTDPDIYQKLTNSVAPSIWQMDDVKKGILCQLFGGSSKVLCPSLGLLSPMHNPCWSFSKKFSRSRPYLRDCSSRRSDPVMTPLLALTDCCALSLRAENIHPYRFK